MGVLLLLDARGSKLLDVGGLGVLLDVGGCGLLDLAALLLEAAWGSDLLAVGALLPDGDETS